MDRGSYNPRGSKKAKQKWEKKLQTFLEEHQNLTVVNSLPLCSGLVTRARKKDGKKEESVLDFFIVCNRVLPHVKSMKIDEQKEHVLTNYSRMRTDGKVTDSDHYTQYMHLNIEMDLRF